MNMDKFTNKFVVESSATAVKQLESEIETHNLLPFTKEMRDLVVQHTIGTILGTVAALQRAKSEGIIDEMFEAIDRLV